MNNNIDHLILRAKALSCGRGRNKGRPRELMLESEAKVVSKMRKSGCSINSIHSVMVENSLTKHIDYPKFKQAYYNYRLHS